MAIQEPEKVKQREITSTSVSSFIGGLDERGETKGDQNTIHYGRNVRVTSQGELAHRYVMKYWLPATEEEGHEIFPVLHNGKVYNFTADEGKIKYCIEGETGWVVVGGNNQVTTGNGTVNTFLRILDKVVVLNGVDMLRYVDLDTMEMVQTIHVDDPTSTPTLSVTGSSLTLSGNSKLYYGITFNSVHGETKLSGISNHSVSKSRNAWKTDGTEFVIVNRNNSVPANAVSWNLYMATAASGATITEDDMLPLAIGLDLTATTFTDTGLVPLDLSRGTAPQDNSTGGPTCAYGIETDGRPILYGDKNNPHTIYIGGDGEHALDFSLTHGGYQKSMNKGTNYYPSGVIGFRNGQGLPSLTVLFSNTEGLSKQSILEQQTVTYGNISFVVWTATEQNYGAAGVASPHSVVNYNGGLHFMSVDGHMIMDTERNIQNVLSIKKVSEKASATIDSIRNEVLGKVVGTAWSNRIYMTIPSGGYLKNNKVVVYDVTNSDRPIYYVWDMEAQWIGTVSPPTSPAFVYVRQGKGIFKLVEGYTGQDETTSGVPAAFPVSARGPLKGLNDAHDAYKAVVQVVFYFTDFVGEVEVGINYRNENGRMKTKSKRVRYGDFKSSPSGGWSSAGYVYDSKDTEALSWFDVDVLDDNPSTQKRSVRIKMRMNIIASELQWFYNINLDNSAGVLRSVSYEGVNLGSKVDLI